MECHHYGTLAISGAGGAEAARGFQKSVWARTCTDQPGFRT
jgi:hypothetical protein